MDLFPFLCFTVIFCCLVILVTAQGDRAGRMIPVVLIVLEVLLLLLDRGIAEAPFSNRASVRSFLSGAVAVGAMVQFLRPGERTMALLAVFASLQQLLVSLGVIEDVSL